MILLGYVQNGTVYLATDTKVVVKDVARNELSPSNYKIKRMKNGMLVGITGAPKVRQRILAREEIFTLDGKGKLTKKHIVNEIVPALHRFLKENGLYEVDEDGNHDPGVTMLLAKNDELYYLSDRLWVLRTTKSFAIGALADLCECAMNEIDPNGDIEKQLAGIIQRATTYTNFIGGPYVTINTKEQEYHVTEVK